MQKKDFIWNDAKKIEYSAPLPKSGCISRIPYSSMTAFTMCFIGVSLFTFTMIWSFNASVEQIRRILNITNIPWLDKVIYKFFNKLNFFIK